MLLGAIISLIGILLRAHEKRDEEREKEIISLRSKVHLLQVDVKELQTKETIWDRPGRK